MKKINGETARLIYDGVGQFVKLCTFLITRNFYAFYDSMGIELHKKNVFQFFS